jgi:hypothetical protein
MGYISGNFQAVPMLAQLVERESDDRITLTNGITIRVATCTIRGVRGPTVLCTLSDEIAFWRDENSANPDEEVLASLRPAMATVGGGLLLCASSPYAKRGAMWQAFQKHYGKEGDPVLVWKAPTRRMNPRVPQSLIDAALERDPARYSAEYLAEFRGDVEGFVSLEVVAACTDAGVYERAPSDHFRYVGFVDPSGGSGSSFTLAIAHAEGGKGILDAVREIKPPFSPDQVVWEYCDLLKRYGIKRVGGDHYGGEWPREAFRKQGVIYEPCKEAKSTLYANLLPLMNSGGVRLLDNARLKTQLVSLERYSGRSGKDSISAGDNGQDDVANAVAGALSAATAKAPQIKIGFGAPGISPRIKWRDSAPEPLRIKTVMVKEGDMTAERIHTLATSTFKPFKRSGR